MLIAQQKEVLDALVVELTEAPPPGRRLAVEALARAIAELNMWRRGDKAKARALAQGKTEQQAYAYWVVYVYRETQGDRWVQFTDSIGFEYPVLISTNNHLYRLGEYIHREFRKSAAVVRVISATLMPGGQS